METRNEKWQSLRLQAQKFTPQEFVAQCEEQMWKEYEVDPAGLPSGIHCKYDKDQDGFYRENDNLGDTFTSNNVSEGARLYYVGRGWGKHSSGQISWPDPIKTEAEMLALGFERLYLFSNKNGEPTSHTGGVK